MTVLLQRIKICEYLGIIGDLLKIKRLNAETRRAQRKDVCFGATFRSRF